MAQAIDFKKHWLRRESRKLAKQVAEWAKASPPWEIGPGARDFLDANALGVVDLQFLLETCQQAIPGGERDQMAIVGATCDDVMAMIYVRICTCEHGELRHLELVGGKLFTDEEDLVS